MPKKARNVKGTNQASDVDKGGASSSKSFANPRYNEPGNKNQDLQAKKKAHSVAHLKNKTAQQVVCSGCNCPAGCTVGVGIPAGSRQLPSDAVCIRCSNDLCPAVPWLHGKCYDRWEQRLIHELMFCHHGRSRNWNLSKARQALWLDQGYDLIFRSCVCPSCAGYLKREIQDERAIVQNRQAVLVKGVGCTVQPGAKQTGAQKSQPPVGTKQGGTGNVQTTEKPALAGFALPKKTVYKALPGWKATEHAAKFYLTKDKMSPQKSVPVGATGWKEQFEERQPSLREQRDYGLYDSGQSTASGSSGPRNQLVGLRQHSRVQQYINENEFGCEDDSIFSNGQSSSSLTPIHFYGTLPPDQFLKEVETVIRLWGGQMWTEHPVIVNLLERVSVGLMEEIADSGGFHVWLSKKSAVLSVTRGQIMFKGVNSPHQLRGIGTVRRLANESGNEGILFCSSYQCHVYFGQDSTFTDGSVYLLLDDIVSFLAEEAKEVVGGCKWMAVEMSVLQRGDSLPKTSTAHSVRSGNQELFQPPASRLNGAVESEEEDWDQNENIFPTTHNRCAINDSEEEDWDRPSATIKPLSGRSRILMDTYIYPPEELRQAPLNVNQDSTDCLSSNHGKIASVCQDNPKQTDAGWTVVNKPTFRKQGRNVEQHPGAVIQTQKFAALETSSSEESFPEIPGGFFDSMHDSAATSEGHEEGAVGSVDGDENIHEIDNAEPSGYHTCEDYVSGLAEHFQIDFTF